jgi:hypothetical protein
MVLSLGQAAKAVGRSKSALSRDVKAGKISANRNADGSLAIEPSELFRVFQPVSHDTGSSNVPWDDRKPPGNGAGTAENTPQQVQPGDLPTLRERLAKAEAERDLLLDQVADLRTRLDLEAEERRRLTAVLTDRRAQTEEQPPATWPRRVLAWLVKQHV